MSLNMTPAVQTMEDLRAEIVGLEQQVPLLDGSLRQYVYFDNAASTPAFRCVLEKVNQALLWYSSANTGPGWKSLVISRALDSARQAVLRFFGGDPDHDVVIYGKNASEALNILAGSIPWEPGDVVLTSMMEHHSNDLPWRARAQVEHIGVDANGALDLEDLDRLLKVFAGRVKLVAITGASNITGHMPPLHEAAVMAHRFGALLLADCAQLAPHRAVSLGEPGTAGHIDFVTLSAHKIYAPFGTGVLIGPREFFRSAQPFHRGGGTVEVVTSTEVVLAGPPNRFENGSPNIIGMLALSSALNFLARVGMEQVAQHEIELTHYALEKLNRVPGVRIYGDSDPQQAYARLGVIPFNVVSVPHAKTAAVLSFEGAVGVRSGLFCTQPYIYQLLGTTPAEVEAYKRQAAANDRTQRPGLVRVSFGCYNTTAEIDRFVEMVERVARGDYRGQYRVETPSGNYYPANFNPAVLDHYFSLEEQG